MRTVFIAIVDMAYRKGAIDQGEQSPKILAQGVFLVALLAGTSRSSSGRS